MALTYDQLQLETGDYLLLETGDAIILQPTNYVNTLDETVRVADQKYFLDFDGVNDWVDFGVNFGKERTDAFSISFEISPEDLVNTQSIVGNRSTLFTGWEVLIGVTNNTLRFTLDGSIGSQQAVIDSGALPSTEIIKVTATYDGLSDTSGMELYFNGIVSANTSVNNTLASTIVGGGTMYVGRRTNGTLPYLGRFRKLRMYNAKLTAAQVLALNDDDEAVSVEGQWLTTKGEGSTLYDSVGSVNGTIAGPTWSIHPDPLFFLTRGVFYTEALALIDTVATVTGKIFSETVSLVDSFTRVSTFTRAFTEAVTLVDSLTKTIARSIVEAITITGTVVRTLSRSLLEALPLVDSVVLVVGKGLNEIIVLVDTIAYVTGKVFIETIALVDHIRITLNGILAGIWSKTARITSSWSQTARISSAWSEVVRKVTGWNKIDRE